MIVNFKDYHYRDFLVRLSTEHRQELDSLVYTARVKHNTIPHVVIESELGLDNFTSLTCLETEVVNGIDAWHYERDRIKGLHEWLSV